MRSRRAASDETLNAKGAYAIMMSAMAARDSEELDEDDVEQLIAWEENGEVSENWISDWGNETWELRRVKVADLWVDPHWQMDDEKVAEYAAMDPADAPPILLHWDGHPLDGQHRLAAAEMRGDETILAWVPRRFGMGRIGYRHRA